jgi:hypothetical protein
MSYLLESIMNIKSISAVVSSLVLFSVAGAALAEAPYPDDVKFVSTKTRAQVIAELQQARANGEMIVNDQYPDLTAPVKSTRTRAEVIAELQQARERGEIPLNEYSGAVSVMPVASTSTKTRAQVLQELKEYQQAHANPSLSEMVFLR